MTRRAQANSSAPPLAATGVRLDKWLWAARFFRVRGLATEAIDKGQVLVNGQRAKPSRSVRLGDALQIEKAGLTWQVSVTGLSDQRGDAQSAQALYTESAQDRALREEQAAVNRAAWMSRPQPPGHRPDKHERARLRKLLQRI